MAAEVQGYGSKECGSCRWWRAILEDARGPIGPCRLSGHTGDFPGTAPICERYLARDAAIPARPAPSARPSGSPSARAPIVRAQQAFPDGIPEELLDMTREEFAQAIREVMRDDAPAVPLAPKWEGGTLVLKPHDPQLQPKELPLDQFFHKIVMLRDRLRVLEQKLNSHDKLTDAEKVELQQFVTRCYGTLTSFNVLFREEKDRFVGEKS